MRRKKREDIEVLGRIEGVHRCGTFAYFRVAGVLFKRPWYSALKNSSPSKNAKKKVSGSTVDSDRKELGVTSGPIFDCYGRVPYGEAIIKGSNRRRCRYIIIQPGFGFGESIRKILVNGNWDELCVKWVGEDAGGRHSMKSQKEKVVTELGSSHLSQFGMVCKPHKWVAKMYDPWSGRRGWKDEVASLFLSRIGKRREKGLLLEKGDLA